MAIVKHFRKLLEQLPQSRYCVGRQQERLTKETNLHSTLLLPPTAALVVSFFTSTNDRDDLCIPFDFDFV